jgi:hypothetical protein
VCVLWPLPTVVLVAQVKRKGLRYHSHATLSRPCVLLVCEVVMAGVGGDGRAIKRISAVRLMLSGADKHFARARAAAVRSFPA